MKSESIIEITKAIINVMKDVKGIDKTMTIGTGQNAYKGVSDKDVKKAIGDAMQLNGLAIIPIEIDATNTLTEWDEIDIYSKSTPKDMKHKQSYFTTVKTKYLLLHESGEFIEFVGYGHGIDSQDKGAGKATTYALKYALLYLFMVPTGKIDDADNIHSEEIPSKPTTQTEPDKLWLNENTPQFDEAVKFLKDGGTLDKIKTKYKMRKETEQKLMDKAI